MEANILNWAAAGPSVSSSATATSVFGIFIVFFIIGIIAVVGIAEGFICAKVQNPLAGLIIPAISFFGGIFPFLFAIAAVGIGRIFIMFQIPTMIYLVIFAVVRISLRSKSAPKASQKEIDKMNIQDL